MGSIVSNTGVATGVAPGTTNITASSGGITSNVSVLTVTCNGLPAFVNNATATPSSVSTLGTSSISVDVTDCIGNPVPNGTQVDFSLSSSAIGTVTTPAFTTIQGTPSLAVATATFTALNSGGTATITITSQNASPATVNIVVAPPSAGSIEFSSALPNSIGVKGAGQVETSIITFLIKDTNGNPVQDGTQVDFEMDGPNCESILPEPFEDQNNNGVYDAGEPYFDRDLSATYTNVTSSCPNPSTDFTDEFITPSAGATVNGLVSAILHSGTKAGPVTVTATVHGKVLSTGIPGVSIGGGKPSASGFHMSVSDLNIGGNVDLGGYDDQVSSLTVYLSDRYGNTNVVPGTSVSFMTEAGGLVSSDVTSDTTGNVINSLTSQGSIPIDVHPRIDMTVTNGNTQNILTWTPPPIAWDTYPSPPPFSLGGTAIQYDLYWNTTLERFPSSILGIPFASGGTAWSQIANVVSPYTHTPLTNNQEYYYLIVALDGNGRMAQSEILSGQPRPVGQNMAISTLLEQSFPLVYPSGATSITTTIRNPKDGWVTVLAAVQGEEGFTDTVTPNGQYDVGEAFEDRGEPFVDRNDDGVYTEPESYTDLNQNGIYDVGEPFSDDNSSGRYDYGDVLALDPNHNGIWDGPNGVWDSDTLIWTTAKIVFSGPPAFDNSDDYTEATPVFAPYQSPPQTASRIEILTSIDPSNVGRFRINNAGCSRLRIYVSDANLNRLTKESTISGAAGEYDLTGPISFTIADGLSTGPTILDYELCDDDPDDIDPRTDIVEVGITWTVPNQGDITYTMSVGGSVDVPLPLLITTAALPGGATGGAYGGATLQATGGNLVYTWTVIAGSMPPGLTLDASTGAIAGTPTAVGVYAFTVQVDDSIGTAPDTQALTITII